MIEAGAYNGSLLCGINLVSHCLCIHKKESPPPTMAAITSSNTSPFGAGNRQGVEGVRKEREMGGRGRGGDRDEGRTCKEDGYRNKIANANTEALLAVISFYFHLWITY